jgi:hypothetical protein
MGYRVCGTAAQGRSVPGTAMPLNGELPTTSVLFIDGHDADRAYFAEGVKSCSLII